MKILWLCNVALPKISADLGLEISPFGGWLVALADDLLKQDVELLVCFPNGIEKEVTGKVDKLSYCGFKQAIDNPVIYDASLESTFKCIIDSFKPDIVHIFGTEFPHTLAMTKAFNRPNNTIISIQGLCSIYATHYANGLSDKVINKYTLRDFIKRDNIKSQIKNFKKRGKYEIEALANVNNIIGRTSWDKACAMLYNPIASYHFCNESLRDSFYDKRWSIYTCEKNSIFASQGNYPIKGLHFLIEALALIVKRFPDAKLYVAGNNITKCIKLKRTSYAKYILSLIERYKLKNNICFLGNLSEQEMCERYLKSNVFVSASTIENSPNSVAEAMILGVPTVSSDVGGVADMLKHSKDGFLYQVDAPYMLSYYVCEILSNDELAMDMSSEATTHAKMTHSRGKNIQRLMEIYKGILNIQ